MAIGTTRGLVLGHRGAPLEAPENTMAGFVRALERGADGVELDVQRSMDGVPVVIHDDSLERTGHGRGRVSSHLWEELRELRGGGEPIPSLADAARWAAGSGAWLNVEIKARDVARETVDTLAAAGLRDRVILSSFHPAVVAEVGTLEPAMTRYLLLDTWEPGSLQAVAECGAEGVCLRDDAASREVLRGLESEGLPVVVWTVDEPARIDALLGMGVAGIITNRPEVAVRLRR